MFHQGKSELHEMNFIEEELSLAISIGMQNFQGFLVFFYIRINFQANLKPDIHLLDLITFVSSVKKAKKLGIGSSIFELK